MTTPDGTYTTTIHCDECGEAFTARFDEPQFAATCPGCGTYYPELYV